MISYPPSIAHIINIRTTAGKTLAMRQSFKAFTEPLKKDPRFFVCGRGTIINMENAADFQDAAFCMTDGSQVYVSQELLKAARQAFMEFLLQRGRVVEGCSAPDPGAYRRVSRFAACVFSGRSYLKLPPAKLAAGAVPLLLGLCLGGGLLCYHFGISTAFSVLLITLTAIFLYRRTLRISLWKSGTIALAVCAVFACLNSLSRAVGTAIVIRMQLPPDKPWFCFGACIFYNASAG